jgi:PAS domain S-box-containing protein
VNKAFSDVIGKRPEELVEKVCYKIIHNRNEPCQDCCLEEIQRTMRTSMKKISMTDSGTQIEVTTSAIWGDKGEFVGCVRVARDLTERK